MAGEIGGAGGGSCGGDSDAQSSPKNRVKFLCSHGGRILPRPADGHLKYVGGETRVVALSRSITFAGAHFVSLFLLNSGCIELSSMRFEFGTSSAFF